MGEGNIKLKGNHGRTQFINLDHIKFGSLLQCKDNGRSCLLQYLIHATPVRNGYFVRKLQWWRLVRTAFYQGWNFMYLYLIRHGESFVNLSDWTGGNVDEGLTPLGHQQAAALAQWLPTRVPAPDAIYCSTMKRAKETAAPLAQAYGLPILHDDRVREIGNNQRNHDPFPNDQLPARYGDFWSTERPFAPVSDVVENVEALIHFRARVGMFIEGLLANHPNQVVIVVCHGGVIDVAFDHIFDTGFWRRCEVWSPNTAVTCFEHVAHPKREAWRLYFANATEHLREMR